MNKSTRSRILDYLHKYQSASVRELSSILSLTGANIRHHLAILTENDQVEIVGRRLEGRGRPSGVYGISRRLLGDGFEKLADALLELSLVENENQNSGSTLESLAIKLIGKDSGEKQGSIPSRLGHSINKLNELHYMSRWEASAQGPRVILGNCPYAGIIANHPELCRMDDHILFLLLGLPVEQTVKLQPGKNGLPFCAFLVGKE
jgi:predicted ArsR family transcriptional regulator